MHSVQEHISLLISCSVVSGNLGTILRSASGFGVSFIIQMGPQSVDAFSPKVLRASMGGAFHVPVFQAASWSEASSLLDSQLSLGSFEILVADSVENPSSIPYDEMSFVTDKKQLIAIGSEAHGLSQSLRQLQSDGFAQSLFIPLAENTESLNAAVAASILMAEAARQRRKMKL